MNFDPLRKVICTKHCWTMYHVTEIFYWPKGCCQPHMRYFEVCQVCGKTRAWDDLKS